MYTDSFKDEYIGKYYFEALLDENRNSVEIELDTWNSRHFVEILDDHRIKTNFDRYGVNGINNLTINNGMCIVFFFLFNCAFTLSYNS